MIIRKYVSKKTVDQHYPTGKDFLAEFSAKHPEIVANYRESLKTASSKIPDLSGSPFDEKTMADFLSKELKSIPVGVKDADRYHSLMIGVISFVFFPNLVYPKKETEINQGRKRIDITYTNTKESGLFYSLAIDQSIKANTIHVECKNYTSDIKNPEFDQLIGRFNNVRGRLGFLLFRNAVDMKQIYQRACDAAKDGQGLIFPMNDDFVCSALDLIAQGRRSDIDSLLDAIYKAVTS